MPADAVIDRIRALPDRPGIYVFKSAAGRPLYVGKAKSLRKRAANYLQPPGDPRLVAMLAEAADLECVVTDSEAEALLLENNWIKRKRPRYNVLLRDDKTYPYLKLTLADDYPRIAFTRRIRDDGAEYFGPFLPAGLARKAIKLVQKLFEVRVCRLEIDGSLPRPCLYHGMHRCLGPCVAGLTTAAAYAEAVEQARLFLAGRNDELVRRLKSEMWQAAGELDYERAARLRDTLAEVDAISERRKLSSVGGEDVDVYGVHVAGGNAAVVVLVMRNGQVLDRRELFWEGAGAIAPSRLLDEVLPQLYDRTTFIPKEIHLPLPIEGEAALDPVALRAQGRAGLPADAGARPEGRAGGARPAQRRARPPAALPWRPRRGAGRGVAAAPPATCSSRRAGSRASTSRTSRAARRWPRWWSGRRAGCSRRTTAPSTSAVSKVPTTSPPCARRWSGATGAVLEETGDLPDLVLIDGGRGQLNAALEALAELGVEETPVVALAKREEELYLPERPEPLRLRRDDAGLQLLQRCATRRTASPSPAPPPPRGGHPEQPARQPPGVGPKRRKLLLQRFGSLEGVRRAGLDELRAALGPRLGERVHRQLRGEPG